MGNADDRPDNRAALGRRVMKAAAALGLVVAGAIVGTAVAVMTLAAGDGPEFPY